MSFNDVDLLIKKKIKKLLKNFLYNIYINGWNKFDIYNNNYYRFITVY